MRVIPARIRPGRREPEHFSRFFLRWIVLLIAIHSSFSASGVCVCSKLRSSLVLFFCSTNAECSWAAPGIRLLSPGIALRRTFDRSCLWGPRTLISHLSTREFYLPAVKRRLKLAAAAGPSLRQLSHAAWVASEQNCLLQLAKSNRSITTVMTPPRPRMLADMIIGDI